MALFSENNKPNTTFYSLVYVVTYPRVQIHKYLEADSENRRFKQFHLRMVCYARTIISVGSSTDCNVVGLCDLDLSQ